jgi:uncharacterized membrane protein YedE/YeeE
MNRVGFVIGLAFGFLIAASRMSDYDVIHDALRLRDPYIYLVMAAAVGTALPLLWLLERRNWRTRFGGLLQLRRYRVTRKDVLGALVFGTGWAVAGSCPGPALAAAAGGRVLALLVVAGLFAGLLLRDAIVARQSARHDTGRELGAPAPGR